MLASERWQSSGSPGHPGGQTGTHSTPITTFAIFLLFLLGFFLQIEVAASCFVTLQRLSINVAAVSTAENMMDLIDGYCRLEHDTDETVIYRPNKGASGLDCLLHQQNPS